MPTPEPPGPPPDTTLIDYPWVVIRFRCHYCQRGGDSRLAACVAQYGTHATLRTLLSKFMKNCPWDPHNPARKPQKYGMKCGAYLPDIYRGGPPDLPPSMTGLAVIEGGKKEQLPASPAAPERRRRVGDLDQD